MPGRAVCSARGPGGRWTPWHAKRAPGASGGANEVGHESTAEPQGGPLREQKFVAGIFKPAAARAGLPHRLRFHDLRHTCASLLIAQGASIKAVQAQLGHASATVTLDRYGHLFPDELQQLADRLQDAYAEASTDPARTEAAEAMLRQRKEAGQ
jgi:integrase